MDYTRLAYVPSRRRPEQRHVAEVAVTGVPPAPHELAPGCARLNRFSSSWEHWEFGRCHWLSEPSASTTGEHLRGERSQCVAACGRVPRALPDAAANPRQARILSRRIALGIAQGHFVSKGDARVPWTKSLLRPLAVAVVALARVEFGKRLEGQRLDRRGRACSGARPGRAHERWGCFLLCPALGQPVEFDLDDPFEQRIGERIRLVVSQAMGASLFPTRAARDARLIRGERASEHPFSLAGGTENITAFAVSADRFTRFFEFLVRDLVGEQRQLLLQFAPPRLHLCFAFLVLPQQSQRAA